MIPSLALSFEVITEVYTTATFNSQIKLAVFQHWTWAPTWNGLKSTLNCLISDTLLRCEIQGRDSNPSLSVPVAVLRKIFNSRDLKISDKFAFPLSDVTPLTLGCSPLAMALIFSFRKIFSISSSRHVMWLCCQHEKGLFVTILRKIALSNRPSVTETQLLIRFGKQHTPKVVYSLFHLLFVSLLHTYCTYRHLDVILLVISYKSLVNIIPFIWRSAVLGQELDTFFKDPFGCNLFQKSGHFSGGRLNQNGTPKPSRVPGFASVRHGDASDVFEHWGRWRHV